MADGVFVFPFHAPRDAALRHQLHGVGGQLADGQGGLVLQLLVRGPGATQPQQRLDTAWRYIE